MNNMCLCYHGCDNIVYVGWEAPKARLIAHESMDIDQK